MAYVAGDKILDDHYNDFVNGSSPEGINAIFGTGTGNLGLGQTELPTVEVGQTITAAKWNSLFTAMDSVAGQSNTSVTSTGAKAAGDTIAVKSALIANMASLTTAVQAGCASATSGVTAGSVDQALASSSTYDQTHVTEVSFTFAGGDEARWFFNAGGSLRVAISNTETAASSKDDILNSLNQQMGNFDLKATTSTTSGSGDGSSTLDSTGGNLNLGYYDLTTSYQRIFTVTESTSTYAASYNDKIFIHIEAKTNTAHADGRGNNGTVVTIRVTTSVNDGVTTNYDAANPDGRPALAESCGPTTHNYSTVDPNTTYLNPVYTSITVAEVSNTTTGGD